MFNLVGNALKFTEDGSVVINISHNPVSDDRYMLRFDVCDTGIGIDREKQELVFEKFTQADASTTRKYGGTGLGLTICREFCKLMGGDITVESVEGEGSTFTIHILAEVVGGAPAKSRT